MLPAGDLREHQQAHLVAAVDEMLALGVVAGADHVEAQAELQVVGLVPLHARRGGVADVGPALMPIETVEMDQLPVQVEAVRPKRCVPEAHLPGLPIRFLPAMEQGDGHLIEPRLVQVPGGGVLSCEGEDVLLLCVQCEVNGQLRQNEPQGVPWGGGCAEGHPDLSCAVGVGHGEHVRNVAGLRDLQPGLPVEAAVAQVVDHIAEGGLVQRLPGVQTHRQPVLLAVLEPRQQKALGRVPAVSLPFGGHRLTVQEHLGVLGGPVQDEPDLLALPGGVGQDGSGIAAHGLVHLLPDALPGQELHRVGQPHDLPGDLSPQELVGAGEDELPVVVERDVIAHR